MREEVRISLIRASSVLHDLMEKCFHQLGTSYWNRGETDAGNSNDVWDILNDEMEPWIYILTL